MHKSIYIHIEAELTVACFTEDGVRPPLMHIAISRNQKAERPIVALR